MKHTIDILFFALAVLFTAGCTRENERLACSGDTEILALTLDGEYEGTINRKTGSITVAIPTGYDASAMTLSTLELSDGAIANIAAGEVMNMNFPQTITVTNGDVFSDYTVTVKHDKAEILSLRLNGTYAGIIDQNSRTINVRVPSSTDIKSMTVEITTSEGCSIEPKPEGAMNFTSPVRFTVRYNSASTEYTVTVEKTDAPEIVYIGLKSSCTDLNPEEKTAVEWMLSNVPASMYISFDDVVADRVDLSRCKLIWWHLHIDGGIDSMQKFDDAAPASLNAVVKLKAMYESGANFLLTRYATFYAAKIGAVRNGKEPNNCWGQVEESAETAGGPWNFFVDGHETHPVWNGLVSIEDGSSKVYTFDTGYRTTNSTAQWHIGADWGDYRTDAEWTEQTGGQILGKGGDGAVVAWEFVPEGTKGGIVCIGSGCYDWYAHDTDITSDRYHQNVSTMTMNAINYLNRK